MKTLASYGLWLLIVVTCPLLFVGALLLWAVTAPFDRRLRALHLYACAWASLYTYVFPYWTVTVGHRERIRDGETYVLVANHQSLIDILVLFRLYKHFNGCRRSRSSACRSSAEHDAQSLHRDPARRPRRCAAQ